MSYSKCVCNDGFTGDGCSCFHVDRCQDYCDEKMPGSMCRHAGDDFMCMCHESTEKLKYPGTDKDNFHALFDKN